MRTMFLIAITALGLGLVGLTGSSAAPANGAAIGPAANNGDAVIPVAQGCGRGWRRNRFGKCVPIRP